ncbi:NUDIX hydrolase [Streptomyces sp. MS19]|uniref:NUDIX hydrolase n=1 Tax=Streptomyces sp. MS19 TaxID=3385972 RepID=UPI0039A04E0F
MTVEVSQIVRELSHYLAERPAEQTAMMPLYDAARDHAQRRICTHDGRCPAITVGAVVLDERGYVLARRYRGGFAFTEAEPEEQDDALSGTALRLLAEEIGIRDVWAEPGVSGPFLIDVARPGQHRYGPRLRIGFRYLYRAHSSAVSVSAAGTGGAAWVPMASVSIRSVRDRLRDFLASTP